jgi:hypothetical protein
MASMGDLSRGTGNTHVHAHNGPDPVPRGGHWPWRIDNELNTLGVPELGRQAHHVDDRPPEDLPDHR